MNSMGRSRKVEDPSIRDPHLVERVDFEKEGWTGTVKLIAVPNPDRWRYLVATKETQIKYSKYTTKRRSTEDIRQFVPEKRAREVFEEECAYYLDDGYVRAKKPAPVQVEDPMKLIQIDQL